MICSSSGAGASAPASRAHTVHPGHKKARKNLRALHTTTNTILSEDFGVGAPKLNYNPADSGFSQLIVVLSTC